MKKMSIKAVAEALKISTATVSYILNGKAKEKRISDDLSKKVIAFVEKHNYKPNHLAKSLRTGKTNVIGLIVEDIADPFFSAVAGNIENIAYDNGYKIIYSSTKNNTQKAIELIKTFQERNVDGYIITPTEALEETINSLIDKYLPVVLFDRNIFNSEISYVGVDNFNSVYQGVKYLIFQGYKNIAFLTLDSTQNQMNDRLLGYQKAIQENKQNAIVYKFDYWEARKRGITDEIKTILSTHPEIDALFFGTNYLAMSGIEVLNDLRISIGEKMGVLVFDDNDLFRIHRPTISSIDQPIYEMSKQLITTLLKHMENPQRYVPEQFSLPAKLITRDSSNQKITER
ncbi:LacI family transcriptional regulator [Arcicella aurantiaca]|uniref:LacI family transcriptional regulator n=1 Tax=Arcicella aurantiaca TaxID=591202 RepID=A0A316DV73_9BACT|nr:LacI family DNA-binding transcriptional regulator [Arcicella aurantiaca]PWK21646.1 LacI family transcriptional regulator [Arcicella aurantiaca]